MTRFADLGLSEAALEAVKKLGYVEPTPVQEQTIPLVLEGRDVVAAASTGTGKTAAFLLPTMSRLKRAKKGQGPRMLIVSPTRELASQIGDTCFTICRKTGHFMATVYGGTSYGPQIKKLKRGVDILIATPGRLNDLRERGVVNLKDVSVLVLDEADRMLDMGFWPSMEPLIAETPASRQTLLFSATIDRKIMDSVGSILHDPSLVEIAHRGTTAETVEQYIMPIAQKKKPELLEAVLQEKGSQRVIVFARTKNRTEECMEALRAAGYRAESIHSDKSQFKRKRALENFSKGRTHILVATDVLARGIDVSGVDHVINFDLPDCPEDYVHRIGRTGRAGEEGYAISFVSRETRGALRDIERLIGKDIPMMELESYELDPSVLKKPARGKSRPSGNRRGGFDRGNRSERGGKSFEKATEDGKRPEADRGSRPSRGERPSFANRKTRREGLKPSRPSGKRLDKASGKASKGAGSGRARGGDTMAYAGKKQQKRSGGNGGFDYSHFAKKASRKALD